MNFNNDDYNSNSNSNININSNNNTMNMNHNTNKCLESSSKVCSPERDCSAPTLGFEKAFMDLEQQANANSLLTNNNKPPQSSLSIVPYKRNDLVNDIMQQLVHKNAIYKYTQSSTEINTSLRDLHSKGYQPSTLIQQTICDIICGLDSGLSALGYFKFDLPAVRNKTLWRGVSNATLMRSIYSYEPGSIIIDAAFCSTTIRKEVAQRTFKASSADSLLYVITNSYSGRYLGDMSAFSTEDEVLFRPGTAFVVDYVDGNVVYMHEIGTNETACQLLEWNGVDNKSADDTSTTEPSTDGDDGSVATFDFGDAIYDDDVYYGGDYYDDGDFDHFDDVEPSSPPSQFEWYPDWYAEVYPEWYYSTVAPSNEVDEDCGSFHAEPPPPPSQFEWYPDWYAEVYPEWYYSTVAPSNEVVVEVSTSGGSVWKDGRRRSARLLSKKNNKAESKAVPPLLGSTVDHLGRRRSLRLQQKKP